MLDRIYLEITNVCNLSCTFCHKTKRRGAFISECEFDTVLEKIKDRAKHLYFHLMGEPCLHPLLPTFIEKARESGFLPAITTNGTLLSRVGDAIISAKPYKVSVSLHAPEANAAFSDKGYLDACIDFAKKAAENGIFVALRLWNLGTESDNSQIIERLHGAFQGEWEERRGGKSVRIASRIFIEFAERFDWPDAALPEDAPECDAFCYALREQIGILVDGSVVPCCLDSEGEMTLGNIFENSLDEILASSRAVAIYDGFTRRRAVEPLCRKCGYRSRFSK